MERKIITAYINGKAYQLMITINQEGKTTSYHVIPERADADKLEDFIPSCLEFDVDGKVQMDDRIKTAEGAQIAREIWAAIQKNIGPPSDGGQNGN